MVFLLGKAAWYSSMALCVLICATTCLLSQYGCAVFLRMLALTVCLPASGMSAAITVRLGRAKNCWVGLHLCPAVLSGPWKCTARQAFLVFAQGIACVYLQDTDRFCHQTLCDPAFVQYLSETFLCWGGDVRKSDAFTVSQSETLLHSGTCTQAFCIMKAS